MAELVTLKEASEGVKTPVEQEETDSVAIHPEPIVEAGVKHNTSRETKAIKLYHSSKEVREWIDLMNEVGKKMISKDLISVSELKDRDIKISQFEKYCAASLFHCRILAEIARKECEILKSTKNYTTLHVNHVKLERVFLDTTLMRMLFGPLTYDPAGKASNNLSSIWFFNVAESTLENLVTPGALMTFERSDGDDVFNIAFKTPTKTSNHTVHRKERKKMWSLSTKVNGIDFFIVPRKEPDEFPPRGNMFVADPNPEKKFIWKFHTIIATVDVDDNECM